MKHFYKQIKSTVFISLALFLILLPSTKIAQAKDALSLIPNDAFLYLNIQTTEQSDLTNMILNLLQNENLDLFTDATQQKNIIKFINENLTNNDIHIAYNGNIDDEPYMYVLFKTNKKNYENLIKIFGDTLEKNENMKEFNVYQKSSEDLYIAKLDDYTLITNNKKSLKAVTQLFKGNALGLKSNTEYQNALANIKSENSLIKLYLKGTMYQKLAEEEMYFNNTEAQIFNIIESEFITLNKQSDNKYAIKAYTQINEEKAKELNIDINQMAGGLSLYKFIPASYLTSYFEMFNFKYVLNTIKTTFGYEDGTADLASTMTNIDEAALNDLMTVLQNLNQNLALAVHTPNDDLIPSLTMMANLPNVDDVNKVKTTLDALAARLASVQEEETDPNLEYKLVEESSNKYLEIKYTIAEYNSVVVITFGYINGNLVLSNHKNIVEEVINGQNNLTGNEEFIAKFSKQKNVSNVFYIDFNILNDYLKFLNQTIGEDETATQVIDFISNLDNIYSSKTVSENGVISELNIEFKEGGFTNILNKIETLITSYLTVPSYDETMMDDDYYYEDDYEDDYDYTEEESEESQNNDDYARFDVSTDDDAYLGDEDAPITIIEFTDFQCPYCQRFHEETFPQIKENYIDTGKVKFVIRDYPLVNIHQNAMAAAEAAECSGDKYFDMVEILFAKSDEWTSSDDVWSIFDGYIQTIGADENEYKTCVGDEEVLDIEIPNDIADGEGYVEGTPTFFINGIKIVGAQPYSAFEEIIENELNSK